jgi:hypothetical protein
MSPRPLNAVRATVSAIPADSGRGRPALAVGRRLASTYLEEEFLVEGAASAFAPTGPLSPDGFWSVEPTNSAAFRTRVLVRRPRSAQTFNGTVVVEWLNVSSGQDADPGWRYLAAEICRSGYAYVGVSAQQVGISGRQGGDDLAGRLMQTMRLPSLVESDEARYGSLVHPGDAFAYDIFSHVAQTLRESTDLLGGLQARSILALGESQAAAHLTTYVNGLASRERLFDGFLIHSRGSGAALWDPAGADFSMVGPGIRLRTDLHVPVLTFETETDVTLLNFAAARQPDTALLRTWEVAGTAHADAFLIGEAEAFLGCPGPINRGPQAFVLRAALDHLNRWALGGPPAPSAPPLAVADGGRLKRDADGIARGGIRTAAVDVPAAVLSGEPQPRVSPLGKLMGSTMPIDPQILQERYGNQAAYLDRCAAATDRAIHEGFLLSADRGAVLADASAAYPATSQSLST